MNAQAELDENLREMCCIAHIDEARRLIANGADVNSHNKVNGWTCLHWAVKRSHLTIIELLAANGADASLKNTDGDTAFVFARDKDILKAIMKCKNADPKLYRQAIGKMEERKTLSPSTTQKDSKQFSFTPNYLANPVFPHWKTQSPTEQRSEEIADKVNKYPATSTHAGHAVSSEITLKLRLEGSKDFIEIDVPTTELTLQHLMKVCCDELELSPSMLDFLRKLPNTKLRNDKDVQRLINQQELEAILK